VDEQSQTAQWFDLTKFVDKKKSNFIEKERKTHVKKSQKL
jgi:hypothetical protein